MSKIRIVQILGFVLCLAYITILILNMFWGVFPNINNLIFSIILAIVSFELLFKAVIIKSTSTMWFALSLILYALIIIIFERLSLNYKSMAYVFAFLPIISSLIILLLFNNYIYIKLIILNMSIAIPITLFNLLDLKWWIFAIILTIGILFGILLSRMVNLDKEKV